MQLGQVFKSHKLLLRRYVKTHTSNEPPDLYRMDRRERISTSSPLLLKATTSGGVYSF